MRVLHVAVEIFPLVKTGGLADVVAALPVALAARGLDVRVLLPGLPAVLNGLADLKPVIRLGPAFGADVYKRQFQFFRLPMKRPNFFCLPLTLAICTESTDTLNSNSTAAFTSGLVASEGTRKTTCEILSAS